MRPSLRRAARIGEGDLERVDVDRDAEMRADEASAVVGQRQVERVEAPAPFAQRLAQQRLDGRVAVGVVTRPEREQVERHEDDRHLGLDRRRRRLAPEPCLQALERQHEAVLPGEDLAIDDPGPGERPGGLDDLGELRAHVVEVARVEAHVGPALVELGTDAVVLVLDPDLRAEPA